MIKKFVSVKIIYIGLQIAAICGTYDGLNRLNNEMLLKKNQISPNSHFPLPPLIFASWDTSSSC